MLKRVGIKRVILFCSTLALLSSCGARKEKLKTNQGLDVYILMGQSNMAGRAALRAEDSLVQNKNVLMFTKNTEWAAAKNPVHFDKPGITGVGPGLSFGLAMQQQAKTKRIGLVPTAVGGTSINAWVPDGYDKATKKYPYNDAEKRIVEAMKAGTVKGVIWHQGEADSQADSARIYLPKLIALIQRLRKLTGNEALPFVAGELGHFNPKYANINQQLAKLPGLVAHTAVVSSAGLTDKGDRTHFDTQSAILLGNRFAEKMIALQKQK